MLLKFIKPVLLFILLQVSCLFGATAQDNTFKNPLLNSGPDPWMYQHTDGHYYFMATMGDKLSLWKAKTITGLADVAPVTIWTPPVAGPNSSNIWAPEIHHLDGKWYIYYTATDKQKPGDATRFVFVLENAAKDPLTNTWIDKGKINTAYSGLDGSVFEHRGKRYFVYSAYVGPQSRLFIAEMKNPWTISDQQVEIAKPTYNWEKFKDREILEGPQFLKGKKGTLHLIYSASACWDDNYALGMLTASAKSDLLAESSWQKSLEPVFKAAKENNVFGPGHNSFTKSPDGKEDWIVYHAKAEANGACSGRSTRVQKFTWKADGTPDFGIPAAVNQALPKPSGEHKIKDKTTAGTFRNPLLPTGPDPWSIYKDGYYYYTHTMGNRLVLWKTKSLTDLKHAASRTVWWPPATGPQSKQLWAPEIHFLNGKWYMYYAADDGNNDNHRMYVIENAAADPLTGTWIDKGQITDQTNKWAIDGSVFEHQNKLYFIWSGWEGNKNGRQDIYIAPMSNPWTISGERVLLSKPFYEWEKNGDPDVNEGPQILKGQDRLFLIYSASGCWTDFYALGMLSAPASSNLLDPASWQKSEKPVFVQSPADSVFGTGHNSFFKSPDGTEDWLLYHANAAPGLGCGGKRSPRAQKISWRANGVPDFGKPIAAHVKLTRPAGEQDNVIQFYRASQDATLITAEDWKFDTRKLIVESGKSEILLRFAIDTKSEKKIKSVKLQLTAGAAPANNIAFKVMKGNPLWHERDITWTKKPYAGKKLGQYQIENVTQNQVIEIPIKKSFIRKNGTYNLTLLPVAGSSASEFYSIETGDGPKIILEYK